MTIRRSDKQRSVLPANDPAVALAKARSFCAYQERCRSEVVMKLHSFGLNREQAGDIIAKLEEEGFLNDERFASMYAGSKFRVLRWGKVKIRAGLHSKGVAEPLIRQALSEIDDEQYLNCLRDLKDAKVRSLKGTDDDRVVTQKVIAYLASKGFEENLIYQELRNRLTF